MEFYFFLGSAPCRAVLLLIHALGLKPEMKSLNLMEGEQLSNEFIKLNPQHTVPLIVDDGFVLSESRAILGYLADQYGNHTLYPADSKTKAVINQRLMFDIGTLYQRFLDSYMDVIIKGTKLDDEKTKKLAEAFGYLEAFMGDSPWMAGDQITIADYSLVSTISTIEACGFDLKPFPKVTGWLAKCRSQMVKFDEACQSGANMIGDMVKAKMG